VIKLNIISFGSVTQYIWYRNVRIKVSQLAIHRVWSNNQWSCCFGNGALWKQNSKLII